MVMVYGGSGEDVCVEYYLLAVPVKMFNSLMPRPHPRGERVWLQARFLELAEVLKPCNCKCKNAN